MIAGLETLPARGLLGSSFSRPREESRRGGAYPDGPEGGPQPDGRSDLGGRPRNRS